MANPANNVWIIGARLRTLPAAIAPVAVGSALAGDDFHLLAASLALLVAQSHQGQAHKTLFFRLSCLL